MKKYLAWIPALVIMTAIFWFSAQPADVSTEMSDSVTRALLWTAEAVGLTDRLSPEQVHDLCGLLATPVRKAAHITEFAVLHLTVLFALFQWELPWKKWLKAALAVTVAYACTDELHQLFVPGRAGMVTDVLIDSMGAALITGLLWIVGRRREGTPGEDGTVWAAGRPEDRSRRFPGPDSRVKQMVQGAAIAAVYVVLTMAFRPISFGPVQFRISEALCVLPYFTPAAVPGVFLGCLISNLLGGSPGRGIRESCNADGSRGLPAFQKKPVSGLPSPHCSQYADHSVGIKIRLWLWGHGMVHDDHRGCRGDPGRWDPGPASSGGAGTIPGGAVLAPRGIRPGRAEVPGGRSGLKSGDPGPGSYGFSAFYVL